MTEMLLALCALQAVKQFHSGTEMRIYMELTP
jgi:hypothetical protein